MSRNMGPLVHDVHIELGRQRARDVKGLTPQDMVFKAAKDVGQKNDLDDEEIHSLAMMYISAVASSGKGS